MYLSVYYHYNCYSYGIENRDIVEQELIEAYDSQDLDSYERMAFDRLKRNGYLGSVEVYFRNDQYLRVDIERNDVGEPDDVYEFEGDEKGALNHLIK